MSDTKNKLVWMSTLNFIRQYKNTTFQSVKSGYPDVDQKVNAH